MNKDRTRQVMIHLSSEDHAQLRIAAAYAGVSMAEFAKQATVSKSKEQLGSGTATTNKNTEGA